jgi:selenocysteine-specific elongation factor
MVLCESEVLAPVTMAEGELRVLDSVRGKIDDYLEVHLHVGTASVLARVAMLETDAMTAGQVQMVQLRYAEPLAVVPGERFVLRSNIGGTGRGGMTTIGGGRLLGVSNTRLRRQKPWTLEMLAARREAIGNPLRWCDLMLREAGHPMLPVELQKLCLARVEEFAATIGRLRTEGCALQTPGGALVHRDIIAQTAARVLAAIEAFHGANPQRAGIAQEDLLSNAGGDPPLLDLAVSSLLQARQIERNGTVLSKAGWSAQVTDRDQQLCDRIVKTFRQTGWTPPSVEELAVTLCEAVPRVQKLVRLLIERSELVRLDEKVAMHHDAVEAGKQAALRLFRRASPFTTMEFRDALGVSRKYAVPLLDHLDKVRFTVRSGNSRTPGAEAKKLLAPP